MCLFKYFQNPDNLMQCMGMRVMKKRIIVCAACRNKKTGMVVCGVRHGDKFMSESFENSGGSKTWKGNMEDGFVDNKFQFLTRKEAFIVAEAAGQITWDGERPEEGISLFSEDLY